MKRFIGLALVIMLLFSFTACGDFDMPTNTKSIPNKEVVSDQLQQQTVNSSSATVPSQDTTVGGVSEDTKVGIISRPASEVSFAPAAPQAEYLTDFIGQTVGDVIAVYGNSCNFDALTGSSVMFYSHPKIGFYLDKYYETPTMSCEIAIAVSCDSTELVDGLCGAMTYKQLQSAVGSSVSLGKPNYYEDPDSAGWIYTLSFDYKGYTFVYDWAEDPDRYASENGMAY